MTHSADSFAFWLVLWVCFLKLEDSFVTVKIHLDHVNEAAVTNFETFGKVPIIIHERDIAYNFQA